MAIIYTYPVKTTPVADDLILISDSADSNKTKQVKVSSLPGGSSSGVSSFNTLTGAVTITGGTNVTLNPVGNNIEIIAASTPTQPGNPSASVQYNDGAGAFAGSANLTFSTNTLTLTDTLDIKGDGTNPGTLNLYCENTTTPHAVSILGPVHTGATPYSIRLPKEIATQSVYSSGGRILESDSIRKQMSAKTRFVLVLKIASVLYSKTLLPEFPIFVQKLWWLFFIVNKWKLVLELKDSGWF